MTTTVKASTATQPSSPSQGSHRHLLKLLVLVLVLFFFGLGNYPLFDVDEPRYAEAGREMLESGNWITPYFNYVVRFDKPVFFYWLVALAYKLFGVSEFSARFFSAVSATAMTGMLYAFGRNVVSERLGFFSAVIFATSIMIIGLARMSITDMTLSAFMTATTLSLFMVAHQSLRWWLVAGLFAGLAVLTKGPVGIVVPGAIFTLYTIATRQWRPCLFTPWLLAGGLVCLAVAIPWYVLAYLQNGQIFLDALFLHNVTRFSDTVSGHDQPLYFYVLVLVVGCLPWTPYLPASLLYLKNLAKTHRKRVEAQDKTYLTLLFAAVWVGFIFTFFTASHTKLLTYILPLFPGVALMLAILWDALRENTDKALPHYQRWIIWPQYLLLAILAVAGIILMTKMQLLLPREAREAPGGLSMTWVNAGLILVLTTGTIGSLVALSKHRIEASLTATTLTMVITAVLSVLTVVPAVNQATQGVMLQYLQQVGNAPLAVYEIQRPSLTFYGRRQIPHIATDDADKLETLLNTNQKIYIITKNRFVEALGQITPRNAQLQVLEKGRVYSLLSLSKASP